MNHSKIRETKKNFMWTHCQKFLFGHKSLGGLVLIDNTVVGTAADTIRGIYGKSGQSIFSKN